MIGENIRGAWFAIAVAEGVGSVPYAQVGSNLTIRALMSRMKENAVLENSIQSPREILLRGVNASLREMEQEAARRNCPMKHLGTTLLAIFGVAKPDGELSVA